MYIIKIPFKICTFTPAHKMSSDRHPKY